MNLYSTLIKQWSVSNESLNLNLSSMYLNRWFFILLIMMVIGLFFIRFENSHKNNFAQPLTQKVTYRSKIIESEYGAGLINKTIKNKAPATERNPSSPQPQNSTRKPKCSLSSTKSKNPNPNMRRVSSSAIAAS